MVQPPKYQMTNLIQEILRRLDILKSAFSLIIVPPQIVINSRRMSMLKSSLCSARIEGNPLKLDEVHQSSLEHSASVKKREIANILRALNELFTRTPERISIDFLQKLHTEVLRDVSPDAGKLRNEFSTIFNEAGIAVYMSPPPKKIQEFLAGWCDWCNTDIAPGPIKAAVAHFWFEKIHPFLDGNGRVGRLVISWILKISRYDFGGLVSIEEYLDEHRQEYYDGLSTSSENITPFVEFFLTAFEFQVQKAFTFIKNPQPQMQSYLLPRRQEILDTIRDHTMVSFDMLWRRFRVVPNSTLHNDLKQLMKSGHIKKLGITRGVVYTLV